MLGELSTFFPLWEIEGGIITVLGNGSERNSLKIVVIVIERKPRLSPLIGQQFRQRPPAEIYLDCITFAFSLV